MTAGPSYTGYVYDAAGTRVAKGSLTSFSCNFATNGFTPTASYVLGPGGEQVTEYAVSGGNQHMAAHQRLLRRQNSSHLSRHRHLLLSGRLAGHEARRGGDEWLRHRLHQPGLTATA